MRTSAILDPSLTYRYRLTRIWDESLPRVCFVMLNPSTADATDDDPTIRRCVSFARSWGYGSLVVVNVCAFRATDPKELLLADDAIGPENDAHILAACEEAQAVVLAWGCHTHWAGRKKAVLKLVLSVCPPLCLGTSAAGDPKHPLYMAKTLRPTPFPTGDYTAARKAILKDLGERAFQGDKEAPILYMRICMEQIAEDKVAREQGMTPREKTTRVAREAAWEAMSLKELMEKALAGDEEAMTHYLRSQRKRDAPQETETLERELQAA